jgi:hypothetical protein
LSDDASAPLPVVRRTEIKPSMLAGSYPRPWLVH